ncbi:MAG: GTP cyclohydrolase I FolE [Flavobacteriales bacterium]|jgi:GTP cyclohydrolase I|nr:GTP cyclohydrolase I FolE [Flavobacteriales bacterium]
MALYEKTERFDDEAVAKIAANYRSMLEKIGEDPQREGLIKTPERAAKALAVLTSGMGVNAAAILESALFAEPSNEMVLVRDIEVYSLCEHHLLPFFGKAHVAYIPDGKIVGLSKIPRVVDAFSRRLQVQERLTEQIRDCIQATLGAKGVAVVIEARHLCMQMRGVEKQNTITTTSAFTGAFLNDPKTRKEFMQLAIGSSYGRS